MLQFLAMALPAIAHLLGGASKSASESNANRDNRELKRADLQLDRDKFAESAPHSRYRSALSSVLTKNVQAPKVSWNGPGSGLRGEMPQFTGGKQAAYSAIQNDPTLQELLKILPQDALMRQQRGGTSGGNMDSNLGLSKQFGKSSVLDKILGIGAFGSSLALPFIRPNNDYIGNDISAFDDHGNSD